jgi:hypothetical protein
VIELRIQFTFAGAGAGVVIGFPSMDGLSVVGVTVALDRVGTI